MAYKATRVEVKTLIAQNIRSAMDGAALDRLEATMNKDGQKCPILITSSGRIIDGHRRVAVALKLGWTHINAVVVEDDLTPEQITDLQTVHAFHSETLSDWDKAHALKAKAESAGFSNKQLAEHFSLDASEVTHLKSLFSCIPEVQELAAQGKIGRTKWYAVSQSPDQEATLQLLTGGATREEIKRSVKRAKGAAAPAVRTSKIKCPLVSGPVVTVAGDEISLDDAIEALKEAAKAMQKARDTGLDARTAQAVWRDMAAVG